MLIMTDCAKPGKSMDADDLQLALLIQNSSVTELLSGVNYNFPKGWLSHQELNLKEYPITNVLFF